MAGRGKLLPQGAIVCPTRAEVLTNAFYRWERRGRGWKVLGIDAPIALEPPYVPFFRPSQPIQILDDGRKPTLLSSLIDRIRARWGNSSLPISSSSCSDIEFYEPQPESIDDQPLIALNIALPAGLKVPLDVSEQLILSLSRTAFPVSFEVIGSEDSVVVQFVCRESDFSIVKEQLTAHFPALSVAEGEDYLGTVWREDQESLVVEFGLSEEFMRPLKTFKSFDPDPLLSLFGALSILQQGERAAFQILFQAVRHNWTDSMLRAVTDGEGGAFFLDSPEMVPLTKEKIERPLFAAIVRMASQGGLLGRAFEIIHAMTGAVLLVSRPGSNELIPLENEGYPDDLHEADLFSRSSHRSGMLLNSRELVSFAHLPSESVRTEKLRRESKKTKSIPAASVGHRIVIGENNHQGRRTPVTLSEDQRLRHMHVIGATGTGKSTLLRNLIMQDIANGEGVGVIDPHGDLIDDILGHIPEDRSQDVVLFDPSDSEYPIGFNILSAHSELETTILASDLVAVFRRLSTSWGDQMNSVLANAILAFLESEQGGTLSDLRRFLVEAEYRRTFLKTVRDREVVYYWEKEYPLLSGRPHGSVLTRLDTFLRPKVIRNMVSQRKNTVNMHEIVNGGKIFLAKLGQGLIGEENAYLLGAFLVSKFHQVTLGRQDLAEVERRNFFLTIDEFQNFITPSLASLLSGARKYRLGLILAHQELRQLWAKDSEVASAVISNPCVRICFRLGDFDAEKLADGFSYFDAKDLRNLGVGEAIGRIERTDYDFNLTTGPFPSADADHAQERRASLIRLSRERYATRRGFAEAASADQWPADREVSAPRPTTEEPKTIVEAPPDSPMKQTPFTPKTLSGKPELAGRGGQQHKYLQQLVKRMAEGKGFQAIVEHQILGGLGSIDVAIHGQERKIACEISVSSTCEQELGNVQKCLAAGYDQVILLSPERKALAKLQESVSLGLDKEGLAKVLFLDPEEVVAYLDSFEPPPPGPEKVVRGYRVKVQYKPMAETEKRTRRKAVTQVIAKALLRFKGASR